MKPILVLSPSEAIFSEIRDCFHPMYHVDAVSTTEDALEIIKKKNHDFLLIDLVLMKERASHDGYKPIFTPFWLACPDIEIIVLSSQDMIREAVMAVKGGASNYLTYPVNRDEGRYVLENIVNSKLLQSELDYLRDKFWDSDDLGIVNTRSSFMQQVFDKIQLVSPTKSTVLLTGETGTGKGVLAKLIHKHSNRRFDQFISVHCGAIPDTLLESELFGHEKGAFTGATRRQLGKFEIARGGTIFLDEVGTISPSAQIKLLQVLQEGIFQRIGGKEVIEADVRVIAATNTDLKGMSEQGQFRRDLYYRLNVFPIEIPPLRERIRDIPALVEVFLERLNRYNSKEIHDIDPEVLETFENYTWPGNIRELENLIERAFILEPSSVLSSESFPSELLVCDNSKPLLTIDISLTLTESRRRVIEQFEKSYLEDLLASKKGRIKDTAKAAGITPRQISKLMKRYGLKKEEFKVPYTLLTAIKD